MINNLLIQLIIEKERKKLLIKNTSFRVMKHTTLLPTVYFPSTLVLTFSSWRVRRRCPASLSHLFGRRAASSFTIHPSMRMMKMQSKNRKKNGANAHRRWSKKKKVRNYRRHWDVISSILLLSFSPFCLSFLHVIPSTIYTWTTSRSETAGNNNMSEQWMSMVNVSAAAAKERTFQPSNSRPRVYFFTPNFAQVL